MNEGLVGLSEVGEWVRFDLLGTSESGKTSVWAVRSKNGAALLGHIKWFGRWRRYCFFPEPETAFDEKCLREIAAFGEVGTREHK